MSIRFQCTACHTVLKIGDRISEQKKVRCTGCGLVILLTPDDEAPDGMTVSVPAKMGHASLSDAELSRRRKILTGILVVAVLVVVGGVLWSLRGPSDRGAIEGEVTLDKVPLEKGRIIFTPTDGTPGPTVTVKIENGRYKVSASEGPAIGINRIQIHGDQETGKQVPKMGGLSGEMIDEVIELVAKKWNYESKEKIEIKPGANTKDFAVTRK